MRFDGANPVNDMDLHFLRSSICHLASDWLADAGNKLWVNAWATKDFDMEAVALLAQMAGQLGQEATDAFDRDRWYAATALTRQIVEANYFMAVFRDDPSQRSRWLNASTNRIEKSFRPSQMREAAGFKPSEYKQHCTWGGHPNPSARWLLPNHTSRLDPNVLAADLGQHLTEGVNLLVTVLETLPNAETLTDHLPPQDDLSETYRRWRDNDPFSGRITIPDNPADK